jgi:peptidoglycan/xylan/chitin deacetylase (PgdA/CDA1 family)
MIRRSVTIVLIFAFGLAGLGFALITLRHTANASGSSAASEPGPADPTVGPNGAAQGGSAEFLASAASPGMLLKTTGGPGVALTFDDGPDPAYTPQLLALLRRYHVKATFCLIGVHVPAHPELVKAIVEDGHTLCNHTWAHDLKLGTRSRDAIRADIVRTSEEIRRAVPGAVIPYFRHPGGNWTKAAITVAGELGMKSLHWTLDPRDWDTVSHVPGPATTNHIIQVVTTQTRPGSIVLSHDGGGDRSSTMAAYGSMLAGLTKRFTLIAMPR